MTAKETRPGLPAPECLLLKKREVETMLHISRGTLESAVREGRLPAPINLGRKSLRWRRTDIAEFIATGRVPLKRPSRKPRSAAVAEQLA